MKPTIFVLVALIIATFSYGQCVPSSVSSPVNVIDDASIGALAWVNPGNAISSDDSKSVVLALSLGSTQSTHYIMASNFGFSIPTTSSICGIVAEIEKSQSGLSIGSSIKDNAVRLVIGGVVSGNNLKATASWPTSDAYTSYGGSGNLWGLAISPSDVNSSNFGIAMAADVISGLGLPSANIDHIRITVYYDMAIGLPVTWLNFSATAISDGVKLSWETGAEPNNRSFMIERSPDGHLWAALDSINSKANAADYQWFDLHPLAKNYYRVRQTDLDGRSSFSKTVVVKYSDPALHKIEVSATSSNTLTIECPDKITSIQIFDLQGRQQALLPVTGTGGHQQISTSKLMHGIYIVQVVTNQNRCTKKILISR